MSGLLDSPKFARSLSSRRQSPKMLAVETTGDPGAIPPDIYGHTAVLDEGGGGVMIIFGGCNTKGEFLSTLHELNLETFTWRKVSNLSGTPEARQFHSAVLHHGYMYVFGGTGNTTYNDLHRYHIDTQTWSKVKTRGSVPSKRYGHTAVVLGDSMYIFGGFDQAYGLARNDLYTLNLVTMEWKLMKTEGIIPKDLYHHCAVVHQGSMYVCGGCGPLVPELLEYRFGSNTWSVVNTTGGPRTARWGCAAAVCQGVMLLCGGRDAVGNFGDLYEFHFESFSWIQTSGSHGISPRFFHSAIVHDDYMYIFGGRNLYHFSFSDLYKCSVEIKEGRSSLIANMRSLLYDAEISDVTFIFPKEEGLEVTGHRNILSARCPVFRAMFRSGMKEGQPGNKVKIENMSSETFIAMLEYLYTGLLKVQASVVLPLIEAADLYGLEHLKGLCADKAARYMDADNVHTMLLMAEKYNIPKLKVLCQSFLVSHDLAECESATQC